MDEEIIKVISELLDKNSILTIMVSAAIGIGIALFVRFGIKPRIETVYENNRNSILGRLLIDLNNFSSHFDNAHRIFEIQGNFTPGVSQSYQLSVNQIEELNGIYETLSNVYEQMIVRRDILLFHITIQEFEDIERFLGTAIQFFVLPSIPPHFSGTFSTMYNSRTIDLMRQQGWRVINRFPYRINYDFIRLMRKYDGFELQ